MIDLCLGRSGSAAYFAYGVTHKVRARFGIDSNSEVGVVQRVHLDWGHGTLLGKKSNNTKNMAQKQNGPGVLHPGRYESIPEDQDQLITPLDRVRFMMIWPPRMHSARGITARWLTTEGEKSNMFKPTCEDAIEGSWG